PSSRTGAEDANSEFLRAEAARLRPLDKAAVSNCLRPMAWECYGPVERFLGGALNPQEKALAESFLRTRPWWSWLLFLYLGCELVYAVSGWVMPSLRQQPASAIGVFPLFLGAAVFLPIGLFFWKSALSQTDDKWGLQMHRLLPVSRLKLARLVFKV